MTKKINDILDRLQGFKTFSSVIQRINSLLMDDSVEIHEIAGEILKDPSMVSNVLRLANSSYYGLSTKVTTIPMAMTVLGLNTVRNLITTVSILQLFKAQKPCGINPIDLWWHSIGCAIASELLMYRLPPEEREAAFICGIIHDIGKLAISQVMPDELELINQKCRENPEVSETVIETELLGFTHSQVGAELAGRWHFPDSYREAIRFHHEPEIFLENILSKAFNEIPPDKHSRSARKEPDFALIGAFVYMGNQIAKMLGMGTSLKIKSDTIDEKMWNLTRIQPEDIRKALSRIKEHFYEIKLTLSLT